MQRRAVAIYAVLFVVLGAASYSLIATASAPTVTFENPDHSLSEGDRLTVDDRQYTVSSVSAETSEGEVTRSGELTWTNDSARYTQTWEHNATVTHQDEVYRVVAAEGDDPSTFRLQEEINRTAILQEDDTVNDEPVTVNGTDYVVREEGDDRTLIPTSEYFPEPASTEYSEGDTVQYRGNATTVSSVTGDGATLAWSGSKTNTVGVDNNANVTLNGRTYFAHFPDNSTLVLEGDYGVYASQTEEIDTYRSHVNGLWGVSIVSFATAVMLLGMAYMPSRY